MNSRITKSSFALATALVAVLFAIACGPAAAPSPTPTTAPAATTASAPKPAATTPAAAPVATAAPKAAVKFKFGYVPNVSLGAMGAAIEKGWLKEAGVDLEAVSFARGTELLQALTGGQIDAGYVGAQSAPFNAIAKGADFRFISTMGQVIGQEQWLGAMMIRTDLWDSGARTLKDLKGKTIKISVKGGITYYQFQKLAEKEGMKIDDFKISTISNVEAVDALRGKSIDGGVMYEPEATRIVQDKLAVIHSYDKDLFPKGEVVEAQFVLASGSALKNMPDTIRAFLEAYKKGINYYMDARDTGKNAEEVAGYIEKYAKVPKEVALESRKAGGWVFVPRDGVASAASLMKWQQEFKAIETLDEIVPQDSLFAKGVSLFK